MAGSTGPLPAWAKQIGRDFGDSARSQRKFQAFQNDFPSLRPSIRNSKFLMIFFDGDGASA